jgi:L-rhamnose mutarotase
MNHPGSFRFYIFVHEFRNEPPGTIISKRPKTNTMIRNAFKMKLKPGFELEYKKRHDAIWPELSEELSRAGISDYSIFLDEESLTLFAVQKLTDDHTSGLLPQTAIVKKWWAYMADIMETNPDNSPFSLPLKEVFHME